MTNSLLNMTNSSGNSTCEVNDGFKNILYSSVFSIVFVLGLLLNMVALYVFVCTLKHRNETTTYMMNLVVSDTLFVFTLPLRIFYFINKQWHFGQALCKISVTMFYTNLYGSILFLTCISADRFLAIVYPLASRSLRTKRNAKIVCCVVWAFLLSGSFTVGFTMSNNPNTNSCFENFSSTQWQSELSKVVVYMETVGFVIPLIINVLCSIMILRTLRNLKTLPHGGQLNKAKILRMIVVHLLIFCCCFIPYNVTLVFYALVRRGSINNCTIVTVVKTFYPIAICIAVTNCCFDPVVYYFTSETIQNSIKNKAMARRNAMQYCDARQREAWSMNYFSSLRAKFTRTESTV